MIKFNSSKNTSIFNNSNQLKSLELALEIQPTTKISHNHNKVNSYSPRVGKFSLL